MIIGGKNYRIYNSFDPIAPRGGEHVVNSAGALNYYMWIFNTANGFSMAKIDMELNIFYYDKKSNKFISPGGLIFIDEDNGNP
jgi:hypothetical protein